MDQHHHLKIAILCFLLSGQWNYKMSTRISQMLYNGFGIISALCAGFMCFGVIVQFVLSIKTLDIKYLAECLSLSMLATLGRIKIMLVFTKSVNKIILTIQNTEQKILEYSNNSRIKKIYEEQMNKNIQMAIIMYAGAMLTIGMYAAQSLISEITNTVPKVAYFPNGTAVYRKVIFPLEMWVPYSRSIHYGTYLMQSCVFAFLLTTAMAGANNMFIGIMSFAVGQLKCLQDEFRNITNFDKTDLTEPEIDSRIYLNTRRAIVYHQRLIRFVEEINEVLNTFLFVDALSSVMQIAISSYYLTTSEKLDAATLKFISHLMVLVYQLFMFSWYANEIILESLNIIDSCYESEWYSCKREVKKMLLIVMMRSLKPLQITAGPLFPMSMPTMLMVLKSSYTYCATLREFTKASADD